METKMNVHNFSYLTKWERMQKLEDKAGRRKVVDALDVVKFNGKRWLVINGDMFLLDDLRFIRQGQYWAIEFDFGYTKKGVSMHSMALAKEELALIREFLSDLPD